MRISDWSSDVCSSDLQSRPDVRDHRWLGRHRRTRQRTRNQGDRHMNENLVLLDPTAETAPAHRQRRTPPSSLDGVAIGLLDLGKVRGAVFVDQLDKRLTQRGFTVKSSAKPPTPKERTTVGGGKRGE